MGGPTSGSNIVLQGANSLWDQASLGSVSAQHDGQRATVWRNPAAGPPYLLLTPQAGTPVSGAATLSGCARKRAGRRWMKALPAG